MNLQELKDLAQHQQISHVNFVESGCSPLVIELSYEEQDHSKKALLKSDQGAVLSFRNIAQAYDICRKAGIHSAHLVQVIPHDEACAGEFVSYDQQSIPLKF